MLWVERVGNRRSYAILERNFAGENEASGKIGKQGHRCRRARSLPSSRKQPIR
jgi:hypothetical protein